jgi:hypothetical protein
MKNLPSDFDAREKVLNEVLGRNDTRNDWFEITTIEAKRCFALRSNEETLSGDQNPPSTWTTTRPRTSPFVSCASAAPRFLTGKRESMGACSPP